jgi:branched-chain amino acid transport system permease protein
MHASTIVIQLAINIIAAGGAYALVAAGYTIVHSTLKFINFQHGYMVALGGYVTYALAVNAKLNFVLSAVIAIVAVAASGIVIERVCYRPLRRASRLAPLLVSLGLTYVLQSIILFIWGPAFQSFDIPTQPVVIGGAVITTTEITMVGLSLLALLALDLFLRKSKLGIAMRALSDNLDAAGIMGIDTDRLISAIFVMASGLAALAGVLIGLEYYIQPTMGFPIIIRTLAAVTLGGIGNIQGAIVGSYAIALVENLGVWFFSPAYRDAYPYVILIVALLLRSRGLLGRMQRDRAA